jgi:hypothetical protein
MTLRSCCLSPAPTPTNTPTTSITPTITPSSATPTPTPSQLIYKQFQDLSYFEFMDNIPYDFQN